MQAPFEPAPVRVEVRTALPLARAVAAIAAAPDEERFVEPSTDPSREERSLLRLAGGVVDDEVLVTAQRWATREKKASTPQPLTFRGTLRADAAGTVLVGEIVAPIARVLWFVPSAAFAFGLIAGLDGNLFGVIAGPVFALLTVGVFRLNQWDTLKDAPQLERALREILEQG